MRNKILSVSRTPVQGWRLERQYWTGDVMTAYATYERQRKRHATIALTSNHNVRSRNDVALVGVIHLTRLSSATAGGSELCLHFILHNSSLSLSVGRPAVGWSVWLGGNGATRKDTREG